MGQFGLPSIGLGCFPKHNLWITVPALETPPLQSRPMCSGFCAARWRAMAFSPMAPHLQEFDLPHWCIPYTLTGPIVIGSFFCPSSTYLDRCPAINVDGFTLSPQDHHPSFHHHPEFMTSDRRGGFTLPQITTQEIITRS